MHVGGLCDPPVDSASQWGEWLRASPGRNSSAKEASRGATMSSNNSFGSGRTGDSGGGLQGQRTQRDVPAKRNLQPEFSRTADQRTGAGSRTYREEVNSPSKSKTRDSAPIENDLRHELEQRREKEYRNRLFEQ